MTNTERIQANNAELRECIDIADGLPVAREPVIEALSATANGTYAAPTGVDGYSPITVNVPVPDGYIVPSGELKVTENGTHDVTEYASVNVNVPTSGDTSIEDGIVARTLTEYSNDRVTAVGAYVFHSCTQLTKVNLPKVTSLGISTFNSCTALTSVEMPLLKSVVTQTFYGCASLETFSMPSLTTVGAQAVRNCKKLARVELNSATSIAALSFDSCSALATLIVRTAKICTLANTSALTGTLIAGGSGYIYVPATLVDSYKAATNWSTYANQIRAIEDYPEICGV